MTDRYTKTIDQLRSDKLDERTGGIYAPDRAARDSFTDHPTAKEVPAAFIGDHIQAQWSPHEPDQGRTRPDVQATLADGYPAGAARLMQALPAQRPQWGGSPAVAPAGRTAVMVMVGLGFMRLIAEYSAELVHLRGLNPHERSDVPVIILSAKDTEVDKAVGLELGADYYVTKPLTWRELAAWIQAMRHSPG